MALKIKSAAEIAKKWGEVTPGRSNYYSIGAAAAGADWEAGAKAAGPTFKAAVSAGNIQQLYLGGIAKAGAAKYTRKVSDVGVGRFGSGVTAAVGDMQTGMEPMVNTISALTLPARGPRGDAGNINRVTAVATALHKARLTVRAAGA